MTVLGRIVLSLGGLMGAGGVALAATASHVTGGADLALAAQFLLLHAAAAGGLVAASAQVRRGARPLLWGALTATLGACLFAGDLALRALAETKLLWGVAPQGGGLMILGWLAVAAGGAAARR